MPRDKHIRLLDQLPSEFRARDYRALMGPHVSSANSMISHLVNKGYLERTGYGTYRKLPCGDNGAPELPASPEAPTISPLRASVSSIGSLFADVAAILSDNNALREENSTLRAEVARLREESTWLTSEINRWAEIARSAKQIRMGGGELS